MEKKIPKVVVLSSLFGLLGSPTEILAQSEPSMVEEIVVTAQRREESIQSVPIAVSAFSSADMGMQRIDEASDLQNAVPNLTYTGGSDGFQIRGVGNAVGGATGDVGVGVHHNSAPQLQSRIANSEFLDVDRVEILRGPQGTLYGRNSTGGVINVISKKPDFDAFSGDVSVEFGNYGNQKISGAVNIPFSENYALRIAANKLSRDGYTENVSTGSDIDDRDLWSGRVTFAFQPTETISGWLLWEKYDEDDSRREGARSLCVQDAPVTQVGSTPVNDPVAQLFLSRGCGPGSLYADNAFSYPNSVGTFGGRFALLAGVVPGNTFAGQMQSTNLRETEEYFDPSSEITNEIFEGQLDILLGDYLTMSLLGHSSEDESYSWFGSGESAIGFLDTPITPGGQFLDFQSGLADGVRTLSIIDNYTKQESVELRLYSGFDSAVNFSLGLLKFDVERENILYVSTNATTAYVTGATCGGVIAGCPIYFDTAAVPDYTGHQYFVTETPYELSSKAIFGEMYYQVNDTVKLTTGLRYTDDTKKRTNLEIQLLSPVGASGVGTGGYPPSAIRDDEIDFQETTGRVTLDWTPDVSFSDSSLFYATVSRGYKAGGFNSPEQGVSTIVPYKPEFVNAFEVGTKNLFHGGRTQLNATFFYYDYQDYQISKVEQFSSRNENIDAKSMGIELETAFEPVDNLRVSANVGWLNTEIKSGSSIDSLNRTAGDPAWTSLKGYSVGCVAPTPVVEGIIAGINATAVPAAALFDPCASVAIGGPFPAGVVQDLSGNELPNAPSLSASLGLDYGWEFGNWNAIARLDYSWKDDSYAAVFNNDSYLIKSWSNANFSLLFENYELGVTAQLFVKNIFDDDTIVNYSTGSDGLGLVRNLSLLDPRLIGLNVKYQF